MILLTTNHLITGRLEGRFSFEGYFSVSTGAFISLCTQALGELCYGARIPISYTPGPPGAPPQLGTA